MVFLKSRAVLGVLVLAVAGTGAAGAEGTGPEGWREVFVYCQEVVAGFGEEGEAVVVRREAEPPAPPDPSTPPFDPDGEAAEQASGGDAGRKEAFMVWLEGEYAVAGETVLVAGTDGGGVYVLSEHGAAARGLKRYDMAEGRAVWVTDPGEARELVGPVFSPGEDGGMRLAGLVWNSPEGARTEWLDPAMGTLQEQLEAAYPGAGFDWVAPSPDGGRWIVRVRHRGRPAVWLCVDAEGASWRVLAECPVVVSPTVREVFRWTASDGMRLTGVYTRPEGGGAYPLVVFPHGGPGAVSTTDFDERVWALADAGFAVFQPNYRGSAGGGKALRFAGWGAEGIRRALEDVREGVAALRADPEAGRWLDGGAPALLGGSWGGYVAVAELAMHPGEWAGAVSFFGVFDLPELVRAEWARAGEGETAAAAERARRSLRRQFGEPGAVAEMEALRAVSPVCLAGRIREPVVLFHNRGDRVIAFGQSEGMAAALQAIGGRVRFCAGEGGHGWRAETEAGVYGEVVEVLRGWVGGG